MTREKLTLLFAEADRERLQPVLDALREKGLQLRETGKEPGRQAVVLAVLSEAFYADEALCERLLGLIGAGAENVLPLQIDSAPVPDTLKNAIYSRNIIPAEDRDAKLIAERITAALPKRKNRLPLLLGIGGAVLLIIAGILIAVSLLKKQGGPVEETAKPVYAIPEGYGINERTLEDIQCVAIVGDDFRWYTRRDIEENGQMPSQDAFAYQGKENGEAAWFSKEDGHRYPLTRYDDLRFISRMPNLKNLYLIEVEADAEMLPAMSEVPMLQTVYLSNCRIDSVEWLSGSKVRDLTIDGTPIRDCAPLTDCTLLRNLLIDLEGIRETSFAGFAPQDLQRLIIQRAGDLTEADLSALAGCSRLQEVFLQGLPLENVDFLADRSSLAILTLYSLEKLSDISAVGTLKSLTNLRIEYCRDLTDYSPIAGCTSLKRIEIHCDTAPDRLRDASFLRDLPKLGEIHLYSCNLRDMDFLEGIADNGKAVSLGFAGDIQDYSGLASISHYDYLHVNSRKYGNRYGDISAVLPYLQNCRIDILMLYECGNIDLSLLPDGLRVLSICRGDLQDLSGLRSSRLSKLELAGCANLNSLNGLEAVENLFDEKDRMELIIDECPRLTDFSALNGAFLSNLTLKEGFYVPDLSGIHMDSLCLNDIPDLEDLHVLDLLPDEQRYARIDLAGLSGVQDLTPLRRLQIGRLAVPPHLAEQAQEMKADRTVEIVEIVYPSGGWDPSDAEILLQSLEELQTLPKSILKHVKELRIAGDRIYDPQQFSIQEDWEHTDRNGNSGLTLYSFDTGEHIPVGNGFLTDLSPLADLTGLELLELYGQPIRDLNGIQDFASLEQFTAAYCPDLEDASPLFAVPDLCVIDLKRSPVRSIMGIQNLPDLVWLDISYTSVTDLSPLAACDLTAAYERGGLYLQCNSLDLGADGIAALGAIRAFSWLSFSDQDPAVWIPALADTAIQCFNCPNVFHSNADLTAFTADHPELQQLWLDWNPDITDLSCLTELEELTLVSVSYDMEKAAFSLQGKDLRFHFYS